MKAAPMYGPGDIRVEEIASPACPEGGFILKVLAIGLCGSDIRNLTTDSAWQKILCKRNSTKSRMAL